LKAKYNKPIPQVGNRLGRISLPVVPIGGDTKKSDNLNAITFEDEGVSIRGQPKPFLGFFHVAKNLVTVRLGISQDLGHPKHSIDGWPWNYKGSAGTLTEHFRAGKSTDLGGTYTDSGDFSPVNKLVKTWIEIWILEECLLVVTYLQGSQYTFRFGEDYVESFIDPKGNRHLFCILAP